MLTLQRARDQKKPRPSTGRSRRQPRGPDGSGSPGMTPEDRLIWLCIAVVACLLVGVVAGLLTTIAGGDAHIALGAAGAAALGTFGAVLTAIRFLYDHPRK